MKKQIRWFSKFVSLITVIAVFSCVFSDFKISAQKKKPKSVAAQKIYWYVDYTVTVKGSGEKTGTDGDSTIRWSIDRTYSAVMKLNSSFDIGNQEVMKKMNSQQIMEAMKTKRYTTFRYLPSKPNDDMPLRVTIDDAINVITKERGEGDSFENTTVLKNWVADETFNVLNGATLITDNKLLTYNVWLPIVFLDSKMIMRSQTKIDRSAYGYGDAPTHEETPVEETKVRFSTFGLPNVEGLINDSAVIEHKPDRPFPPNFFTAWEYDSGDKIPDKPLIAGVPDSKTNVKVRVRYRFSKTPFY